MKKYIVTVYAHDQLENPLPWNGVFTPPTENTLKDLSKFIENGCGEWISNCDDSAKYAYTTLVNELCKVIAYKMLTNKLYRKAMMSDLTSKSKLFDEYSHGKAPHLSALDKYRFGEAADGLTDNLPKIQKVLDEAASTNPSETAIDSIAKTLHHISIRYYEIVIIEDMNVTEA